MKKRIVETIMILCLAGGILAGCAGSAGETVTKSAEASLEEINKGGFTVAASCHDPQIIEVDGTYYMFGSHMVEAKSTNLRDWEYVDYGVDAANSMFDNLLNGDMEAFSFVGQNTDGGYSVWAPDVYYNEVMKKYVMYFCTTSSYMKSNLCFATADSVEGPYHYVDTILYSGFDQSNADQTNVYEVLGEGADISRYLEYGGYNNKQWPNCIDPSCFIDEEGRTWMVYGSWSGGIFLLEIDPSTGYPIYPKADEAAGIDPYYGIRLAGGGHHSIEGPYIWYDKESGYYYLFLSYGDLQSDGGYQIRQFRSEKVGGPYVDAAGNTLEDQEDHFNYGLKMMGNYTFPSLNYTYMAPGGQSAFAGKEGGSYLTYHQRFDDDGEYHEPRVHQMFANKEGWLVATPFATEGETLSADGYQQTDISGTFYIVNHGTDVSSKIREASACTINTDGSITGEGLSGNCEVEDGTNYIHITFDGKEYDGVIIEMTDEAKNKTLCFTAAGESNETIWGVQYQKAE